jgi:hypothetical protein
MPGYVFDGRIVMQNLEDGEDLLIDLLIFLNIPNADSFIAETRDEQVLVDAIPAQSIALGGMTDQLSNWLLHRGESDISFIGGNGGQSGVGLAVSRPEDLPIVLYLLNYSNLVLLVLEVGFS